MKYEEFQQLLAEPINGELNNRTIMIQMQELLYNTHLNTEILKAENRILNEEINKMKCVINQVNSDLLELALITKEIINQ